jgi:polysaccharide export outer membrane protein
MPLIAQINCKRGVSGLMGCRVASVALVTALCLGSVGCTFFPTSGPYGTAIQSGVTEDGPKYALVKLTPEVTRKVAEIEPRNIVAAFGDRRPPPEIKFGVGDVVSVTIFEAQAGGLFIPAEAGVRPGNFVQFPNQIVDARGNISVPYAGNIRAGGRTATEVQREIVAAINNRAIDPQAIVTLVDQRATQISVLGDVNTPNRFQANPAGEHLLDAITRAGGIKFGGHETMVVLDRNGKRASAPFGTLIYEPANNIWVHPGDTIYVFHDPQTFLAFGASGQQGQFAFDNWRVTWAEGVAKAGGLLDNQADPGSLFLYRREPRAVAEALGIDCSPFDGPLIPVIYTVNFRDPAGYFLATKFQMQNKDVVFAGNAGAVETTKFLQFVRVVIATANESVVTADNTQLLRIDSKR